MYDLLKTVNDPADLRKLARKDLGILAGELRASLADPFPLEGAEVRTAASIGIALFPDHGQDLSALLSAADHAMYKAKDTGDGFVVFDEPDDGAGATRRRAARKPVPH